MRIYKILFFSVLFFLSCSTNKTPPGILPPDDMASVLTDIHLIDGQLSTIAQANDTLYKYGMGQYIQAFKQHHTDSVQFEKSYAYYSRRPDKLSDIYDQVIKNIQAKKDSITKSSNSKNALPRK